MAKKKAKPKKKAVKRQKPKLEIRLLVSESNTGVGTVPYSLYRLTYGKLEFYLAGCRCFTKKQAIEHLKKERVGLEDENKKYMKALGQVGKKVDAAELNSSSVTSDYDLPDNVREAYNAAVAKAYM